MLCYNSLSLWLLSKFVQKKKQCPVYLHSMEKMLIMLNVVLEILSKYLSVEGFWTKISLLSLIK
jgi:hypothetical protein